MAIILSIPLGFLSASNISPNYSIYVMCRVITVFFRAVPEFVMAMILVIAVGFAPIPGVLALGLHTMGFLAKFYAEAIEHIDPGPSEAHLDECLAPPSSRFFYNPSSASIFCWQQFVYP